MKEKRTRYNFGNMIPRVFAGWGEMHTIEDDVRDGVFRVTSDCADGVFSMRF
jgi:hypothetical protein